MYLDPMQDLQIGDNTHKLQEHVPRSVQVAETLLEGAEVLDLPWFTLRRFLGLLFAPDAEGDFCNFASCPLLAPFCSMTSEPTPRGLPSDCGAALRLADRLRSRVEESSDLELPKVVDSASNSD